MQVTVTHAIKLTGTSCSYPVLAKNWEEGTGHVPKSYIFPTHSVARLNQWTLPRCTIKAQGDSVHGAGDGVLSDVPTRVFYSLYNRIELHF